MKTLRFIPLLFLFFFSCEDELACLVAPKGPELDNKEFPIGNLETYYYVDLNAEINNEPRDEDYDYFFNVEGLPDGLDYFVNFRTISIEGDALERGTFTITIYVDVDGPFRAQVDEFPEILCSYSTSKTYTLIIE